MYVNQIDNIIDKILDYLYLEWLSNDKLFQSYTTGNITDFVEQREEINQSIQSFMDGLDISEIQKLINNKENLIRIVDIIKRYVAYYYFLSIAYYYKGTIKEFRNNLIQYSKLQENSKFTVKNFFDTQNNYQLILFYKLLHDISKIIIMTDLQRKTLNILEVKDAVEFLNKWGREYVDNYLLMINVVNGEDNVQINVHNLIKTIVFGEIYQNQERTLVFEILNEIEEDQHEYIYIDVVVNTDDVSDYDSYRQMFLGYDNGNIVAKDLYELSNDLNRIPNAVTPEYKNNQLLQLPFITPIVDDFLRYHRDTERIETETDSKFNMPLVSKSNSKNVQLALLYQQRKKKENTRAQLIVNKIDAISDYYSENVRSNPQTQGEIKKYFQGPLSYRKAVLHNYLEEVHVMNKIQNQGRKATEGNEYYLELVEIISKAYFNFRDFQRFGTSVAIESDKPINVLRYSNIESQSQMGSFEVEMHTLVTDEIGSVVGLAFAPLINTPVLCVQKVNMVDIRSIEISYYKNNQVVRRKSDNGYKAFIKIIKHFFINTIDVRFNGDVILHNNFNQIRELNPDLVGKIIYWVYNPEVDLFETETYENLKTYNSTEIIRYMNANVYDRLHRYLQKKLANLIVNSSDKSRFRIDQLVENYNIKYKLYLANDDKRDLIIDQYLTRDRYGLGAVTEENPRIRIQMPAFIETEPEPFYQMSIDMRNPLEIHPYEKLEAYSKKASSGEIKSGSKCKHELAWNELQKLRTENLNTYNVAASEFMDQYAIETIELDFVCRICGQVLPVKQYVQDGSFDSNTQKFVTAYLPIDTELEEHREYEKYSLVIRYLDALINRFSLITSTNMLVGNNTQIRQKRKAIIKNIIDLMIKHNTVNLAKKQSEEERLDYYQRKFHIEKDLDNIYFFQLDNSVLDFEPPAGATDASVNRLKYNNMLLYFLLIFMLELNSTQIATMSFDKIGNIYTFLKYGSKLFGDLQIKTNVTDNETTPITRYPVLCYLLFLCSYYLIRYKLWFVVGQQSQAYNPYYSKIIINSFVALFNSISIDSGRMRDDYIYLLTSSKMYTALNTVLKKNDTIDLLKRIQIKFSDQPSAQSVPMIKEEVKTWPIGEPKIEPKTRIIPTYKISNGLHFYDYNEIIYDETERITNLTNCMNGSYYKWLIKDGVKAITSCGVTIGEATGDIDLTTEAYYYNLDQIATNRRCIEGTLHDFVGENGKFVCTICHRQRGQTYTREELDQLVQNLNRIADERIDKTIAEEDAKKSMIESEFEAQDVQTDSLISRFNSDFGERSYGQLNTIVDNLINILESSIGSNTNLDLDKYPVYLHDNVYVIDHSYDGSAFNDPIVLSEKDNRIHFKEDHPFFKTDVYYYTDFNNQIDVFYHAVTLKLIGYKEKHKDYVLLEKSNSYLIISQSIRNRILNIGYETQYVSIESVFSSNSKFITDTNENYYTILDSLIRDHVSKIKNVIDKIISVFYKIKNSQTVTEPDESVAELNTTRALDRIVEKYSKLLPDFNLGSDDNLFNDWNDIRQIVTYEPVDWNSTNVRATTSMFVNAELINYYDKSSSILFYYLVQNLITVINTNTGVNTKTYLSQMYVEIIIYIYSIYNMDPYKNSMELKRFLQILNGSDVMIDLLKKGQGLQSKALDEQFADDRPDITEDIDTTDEQAEELEDLKEEAEALDVEGDYYAEEDEDYGGGGDAE